MTSSQMTSAESAEYAAANQYIQSPNVVALNVTDQLVHDNLWPLFQKLLATTNDEGYHGWEYASAFNYALGSVKNEYGVNNGGIMEERKIQCRMCFYFIMYIHH